MRQILLVLSLVLLLSSWGLTATKIELNRGWSFRTDPEGKGSTAGWTKEVPSDTETVNVPHTWNIGKLDDYEGVAWYFRTFELPVELAGKHIELNFGATFYSSRVW